MKNNRDKPQISGILPINKPGGVTSFSLVRMLRKQLGVQKIGHAGTLDPFATGVMVMLIGRDYTRLSDSFLNQDKEYIGTICLGAATDTYDCEGKIMTECAIIPTLDEIEAVIALFQGTISQIPPMFSAKKINGVKLYDLARKGQSVERAPVEITLKTTILNYSYPHLKIGVKCSKGTYIRSIAHDIGQKLGVGGHLSSLTRTRSGSYTLSECINEEQFSSPDALISNLQKAKTPDRSF